MLFISSADGERPRPHYSRARDQKCHHQKECFNSEKQSDCGIFHNHFPIYQTNPTKWNSSHATKEQNVMRYMETNMTLPRRRGKVSVIEIIASSNTCQLREVA